MPIKCQDLTPDNRQEVHTIDDKCVETIKVPIQFIFVKRKSFGFMMRHYNRQSSLNGCGNQMTEAVHAFDFHGPQTILLPQFSRNGP